MKRRWQNRHRLDCNPRAGSVLLLAVVAVLVVSVFAASFLQLNNMVSRRQARSTDNKEAFYLAEAGLAEAYTGLAEARTGNVGSQEEPAVFGDGLFWVEATEVSPTMVELECTAMCSDGRVTLGMVAERIEVNAAALGMFSVESIAIGPDSLIDGYDSGLGSYADQVAAGTNAGMGILGTNDDITVDGGPGTTIDGVATPGISGSVTTSGSVTITGSMLPRTEQGSLAAVSIPPVSMLPAVAHAGLVPLVVPPGDGGLERLEIGPDAQVILTGPAAVVLGSVEVRARGNLHFDTSGGPITLYVENDAVFHADSSLTSSTEDPSAVTIQLATDELGTAAFNADSTLFGSVYAPLATLQISNDFELFGAVAAKQMTLSSSVKLHFDQALTDSNGSNLPTLLSWRVVDIPDNVALRGGDPFRMLGVSQASLPVPSEAHEDQWLEIDYLDKGGLSKSYQGLESSFDWMDVGKVTDASRDGESLSQPGQQPKGPTPTEQALIDIINDPKNSTGDIKDALQAASPLTALVLEEAILADEMSTGDLKDVLQANSPLPQSVLDMVLDGTAQLSSGDKAAVLAAQ